MPRKKGQLIKGCQMGSIAAELEIAAGDRLVDIDGQPVRDVFDYRLRQLAEALTLRIEHADGTVVDYEIEKDEDEDLGLEFEEALLDECTHCHNKCVFCFIDQLPKGLRKTLYFKDDDLRLTFLTGNYVTLTNITDQELDRLITYRFSPMNISVHTTDPELRVRMMKNPQSGQILPRLQRIAAAGIALNTQIVLCPGWNDQEALEKTLHDLAALRPSVQSIAIVPVGVTRFREENNLPPMRPFTAAECQAVLETVQRYQTRFLQEADSRILYASDEFYLRAGWPLPAADDYDDFPQLENGVGLVRSFLDEWQQHSAATIGYDKPFTVDVVCGVSAAKVLAPLLTDLSIPNLTVRLVPVVNDFFGHHITVTGLLTGRDILRSIQSLPGERQGLIIPGIALRKGEAIFLDGLKPSYLEEALGIPVRTAFFAEDLLNLLKEWR